MRRVELTVSTIIVLIIGVAISSCQGEPESRVTANDFIPTVKTDTAEIRNAEMTRQFPARISAALSANVAIKTSGQINSIYIDAGDRVNKGDMLLTLDSTDYELKLKQAQASYNAALAAYDRAQTSFKQQVITQVSLDNAKTNFDSAEANLQLVQNQLANTKLYAPFTGEIVKLHSDELDFVSTGQPVLTMHSMQKLNVTFQVPSTIVAQLKPQPNAGKRIDATVRFDQLGEEAYSAVISEFNPVSDLGSRSINVTLTVVAPPRELGLLLPGMDATVLLDLSGLHGSINSLTVPVQSVFQLEQESTVWRIDNDRIVATPVETGQIFTDRIEILNGLQEGDQVVSGGVHSVFDGQRVTVWAGE